MDLFGCTVDDESALGGVRFSGIWLMVVGGRRPSRESYTRIALSEKRATGRAGARIEREGKIRGIT